MATYYISNNGLDTNNGLSTDTPFQTISKLKTVLQAGDRALFKNGHKFYGTFTGLAGSTSTNTIITGYGEGNRPIISAGKIVTPGKWILFSPGIYRVLITDPTNYTGNPEAQVVNSIGHLVVNGITYARSFYNSTAELTQDWDFYSATDGYVYVKLSSDINVNTVLLAPKINIFNLISGLEVYGIQGEDTGAHFIGGNASNCIIANNKIRNIGGSWLPGTTPVRYGNAVEIYGGGKNINVFGNILDNVWDVAFTMQGDTTNNWEDISFKNNQTLNCCQSIEFWVGLNGPLANPSFINCMVENNYFGRSGTGMSQGIRPDPYTGVHFLTYSTWSNVLVSDLTVRNNVFDGSNTGYTYRSSTNYPPIKMYGNTIILDVDQNIRSLDPSQVTAGLNTFPIRDYQDYQTFTNLESDSKFLENNETNTPNRILSNEIVRSEKVIESSLSSMDSLGGVYANLSKRIANIPQYGTPSAITSLGNGTDTNNWNNIGYVNMGSGDFRDFSLTLLFSTSAADPQTAIVNFQARQTTTGVTPSAFFVSVNSIGQGTQFDSTCFMMTSAGYGNNFNIWVKKKNTFTRVYVYELSFTSNSAATKVYINGGAWQTATPTDTYTVTSLSKLITTSAASTSTRYSVDYKFNGTTGQFILPAISSNSIGRDNTIRIFNRGSGRVQVFPNSGTTIDVHGTLVASLDILPGEDFIFYPDGTNNVAEFLSVKRLTEGTSTQTVTSVTSVNIAHGFGSTPTNIILTPWNTVTAGWSVLTVDSTNIIITYPSAITSGANGYKMSWKVS